jgi:hypothetical protein
MAMYNAGQVNMNKFISRYFLLVLLVSPGAANAELYKGISSDGEVVYSDVPFRHSEEFRAPPVAVLEMPDVILDKVLSEGAAKAEKEQANKVAAGKTEAKKAEIKRQAEFKYTEFRIVSPTNKQSIWNNPDVTVSLHLKPTLNNAKKHKIWLLLDGEVLVDNSVSDQIPTGRLERGEHKLQAQVRDSKGKLILKTKTIVVYIHYGTAN